MNSLCRTPFHSTLTILPLNGLQSPYKPNHSLIPTIKLWQFFFSYFQFLFLNATKIDFVHVQHFSYFSPLRFLPQTSGIKAKHLHLEILASTFSAVILLFFALVRSSLSNCINWFLIHHLKLCLKAPIPPPPFPMLFSPPPRWWLIHFVFSIVSTFGLERGSRFFFDFAILLVLGEAEFLWCLGEFRLSPNLIQSQLKK